MEEHSFKIMELIRGEEARREGMPKAAGGARSLQSSDGTKPE